jgi:uncharacterized protein
MNPEMHRSNFEPVAGPLHTVVLLLALAAVASLGYFTVHRFAASGNAGRGRFYLPTMAWEWIIVGYIYWGLRRRGKAFRDIAGEPWRSASAFLMDIAICCGFWIAALMILAGVTKLVHATGMQQAARNLAPRDTFETLMWVALSITAGICEETIFRGYLQKQFVAWTRSRVVGVVLSAVLFGAGHLYQGAKATTVIGVYGLLFGILAEARSNLRPGMIVHAWHDSITGIAFRFLGSRIR